jgi:hypothetical protein
MNLVTGHYCCLNFLAQPIRRENKFVPTSKLAIYEQKCKLSQGQLECVCDLFISAYDIAIVQVLVNLRTLSERVG